MESLNLPLSEAVPEQSQLEDPVPVASAGGAFRFLQSQQSAADGAQLFGLLGPYRTALSSLRKKGICI